MLVRVHYQIHSVFVLVCQLFAVTGSYYYSKQTTTTAGRIQLHCTALYTSHITNILLNINIQISVSILPSLPSLFSNL